MLGKHTFAFVVLLAAIVAKPAFAGEQRECVATGVMYSDGSQKKLKAPITISINGGSAKVTFEGRGDMKGNVKYMQNNSHEIVITSREAKETVFLTYDGYMVWRINFKAASSRAGEFELYSGSCTPWREK